MERVPISVMTRGVRQFGHSVDHFCIKRVPTPPGIIRTIETNDASYGRCSRGPGRRFERRKVPNRGSLAIVRAVVGTDEEKELSLPNLNFDVSADV